MALIISGLLLLACIVTVIAITSFLCRKRKRQAISISENPGGGTPKKHAATKLLLSDNIAYKKTQVNAVDDDASAYNNPTVVSAEDADEYEYVQFNADGGIYEPVD